MSQNSKIKVIIIDDSAFMRFTLREILSQDPEIEVVDTASDPLIARQKIKQHNPDVITLDIQMPNMNGIDFLEKVMTLRPMPVVMISSLTEKGAQETFQALELGAIDYVTKPSKNLEENLHLIAEEICSKIKIAAKANIQEKKTPPLTKHASFMKVHNHFIGIGASTGGVEALHQIMSQIPKPCPPVLIVQHMPEKFTTSFAARMNKHSQLTVLEACNGLKIEPNHAYLAPGSHHMRMVKKKGEFFIELDDGDLVSGHKPSVDVLFQSMADLVPKETIAFILTGMGRDGAKGMKALKDKGALTFGQTASSCVVYGMPRAAKELNAITKEVNINEIATTLMQLCS